MKIQKFNISKPEKYEKDGNEKTFWHNIGTITHFTKDDGSISRIIEIPAIGLKANIFPVEPREDNGNSGYTKKRTPRTKEEEDEMNQDIEYPEENISVEDIPF